MIVVPYHSQIPANGDSIGNLPGEPGNDPIPNGFCTCACMEMLFNYLEGASAGHGLAQPWPQTEIAAVANTNDCQGDSTWHGTYLDDARRAVHFSSGSGGWPLNPGVNYGVPGGGGYSWRKGTPRAARYGFVGIEGNWLNQGWTRQQLKTLIAADYPLIVNVDASTWTRSTVQPDSLESNANESDHQCVENTVSGHSVVLVGYDDRPWRNLFQVHCPTFGAYQAVDQDTFWDHQWTGDFLFIAPWSSGVSVPALGSLVPSAFQVTGYATYVDQLPAVGTGAALDTTRGHIAFSGPGPMTVALRQGQSRFIAFDVAQSGDTDQSTWNCVTASCGTTAIHVDTWGELTDSSTSYDSYTDEIGSAATDTAVVPRPEVGDLYICNIPRWRWWHGIHLPSYPHDLTPGVPNEFFAEVGNQGDLPVTDVFVDFYYGDPGLVHFAGEPTLTPFGSTVIPLINPGETVTSDPVPFVAGDYNSFGQPYFDFFIEAHCADDPPHDMWVEVDGNLACKCVHQLEIDPYVGTLLEYWFGNPDFEDRYVVTRMATSLPPTWDAQLVPVGMDSLLMGPEETASRSIALNVGDPGIGMVDVFEDLYSADGEFLMRTGGVTFQVSTTGTDVPDGEPATRMVLAAPSPNPGSGETELSFVLPERGRARLSIFDAAGRLVASVFDAEAGAGRTAVTWDGRDESGDRVASGVYFAQLLSGGEARKRKMVLLR
ncbi:MAG: T9SS type A sorting domain-containing protein [Candidatus Eisenbacteria bacterium]|nr:T9SS type A sorting domain-containing protein [Candidatus Eisenbacteria bacterium]